jgi:hypothetical protein
LQQGAPVEAGIRAEDLAFIETLLAGSRANGVGGFLNVAGRLLSPSFDSHLLMDPMGRQKCRSYTSHQQPACCKSDTPAYYVFCLKTGLHVVL